MDPKGVIARVFVFVVTAALVVGAVAAVSYVYEQPGQDGPNREPLPENPEFDRDRIVPDRLEATGSVSGVVQANRSFRGRRVLIDLAHGNRVQREDLQPLVSALVAAGHEVRFLRDREELGPRLRNADALVVADPATPYEHDEVERVGNFTDRGGRLLLLGEPNINTIQAGLFGVSVSKQRSQVTELAAAYGISFDTEYVYNVEHNDGNYQRVLADPGRNAQLEGVDRVATYIAAPVTIRHGKRLLVAAEGTEQLGVEGNGPYPLAVEHRDGNVTAVGDASLISPVHATVADNERLLAHLASFLVTGSRHPPSPPTKDTETDPQPTGERTPGTDGETPSTPAGPTPTPQGTQTPGETA
jgi:hypothetical protein